MLEIKEKDDRPFSLTGGFSCFGDPGNNYSLHSIVTLVDMISSGSVKNGMITFLGWFMHKHSIGIYSGNPAVKVINKTGQGIIETYSIQNFEGKKTGVVYGKTYNEMIRFIGLVKNNDISSEIEETNLVGRSVIIKNDGNNNLVQDIL